MRGYINKKPLIYAIVILRTSASVTYNKLLRSQDKAIKLMQYRINIILNNTAFIALYEKGSSLA